MKKKLLISFLSVLLLWILLYWIVPFFFKIEIYNDNHSTILLDSNSNQVGELIAGSKYRLRNLEYNEFPDFLTKSIVQIEDSRFWNNGGIDFFALLRANYYNLKAWKIVQGGSTISSQLVRNLNWLTEKRTIQKKLKEFFLARSLNIHYSKKQILQQYLNNISFGYLNYGFESAAYFYFGKSLKHLTQAELVALMVIPKNPNLYDPLKKRDNFDKRFMLLTKYLHENQIITDQEKMFIESEKLIFKKYNPTSQPYFVDYIKKRYDYNRKNILIGVNPLGDSSISLTAKGNLTGNQVQISVDDNLSNSINQMARQTIWELKNKDVSDFGIIVVDRHNYEIKTYLGGYDYNGPGGQVDVVSSLRQVGSSLKPFTYLLAFRDHGLTPESSVLDIPTQYKTWEGYTYYPKNFSLDYEGEVSVAQALSQSLNITAVKIQDLVGVPKMLNFLRSLGISSLTQKDDYYGLALTLGVGEISLYELTRAYTIFASGGYLCDFKAFKNETTNCKKIIDKKYTDMIEYILSNRYFKLKSFPLDSNLDFPDRFVFIKTGTSRNFADNVAVGYTDNYIIGVWVGNKDGKNMKGVTGVSGAGDIFKKIVYLLETQEKESKPEIVNIKHEKFVRIVNPLDQSIYKINQYRSLNKQNIKLEIETNIDYDNLIWTVDGNLIKDGIWQLASGSHILKVILFNQDTQVGQDESSIIVE